MKRGTRIWLWFALIMGICTTILNVRHGRWPSVMIAVVALVGLCIILFKQMKIGFYLMAGAYVIAFIVGSYSGIGDGLLPVKAIGISLVGSVIVPGITYIFLKDQLEVMK